MKYRSAFSSRLTYVFMSFNLSVNCLLERAKVDTHILTYIYVACVYRNGITDFFLSTLSPLITSDVVFEYCLLICNKTCNTDLTIAHSEPGVTAFAVAERGMLYIRASSPKLPTLEYSPTIFSTPSSPVTKNL